MLNIIKMDLYRMLKTKSMYVIWIVLAAILLITTSLCKTDYELLTEKDAMKQEQVTEPTVDNINVGMMVTLPTEPGEKVTVYDIPLEEKYMISFLPIPKENCMHCFW